MIHIYKIMSNEFIFIILKKISIIHGTKDASEQSDLKKWV